MVHGTSNANKNTLNNDDNNNNNIDSDDINDVDKTRTDEQNYELSYVF